MNHRKKNKIVIKRSRNYCKKYYYPNITYVTGPVKEVIYDTLIVGRTITREARRGISWAT